MSMLKTICVYCGSGPGKNPAFVATARQFGKILAENGIGLIYGGGSIGLMGELAKSVL
jgi:predicted Rossmann-fold nucleotide-binding protein